LIQLKQSDPDYSKLYLYLMKSYLAEGMFDEALQTAEEGHDTNTFDDELAFEAGTAALHKARYQLAETWFSRALTVNPLHHDSLKSMANLYLQQNQYENVIDLLENIDDIEEQDPVFFWMLASAKREEEQYETAHSHYERAYPSFIEDPSFLEEYGNFLIEEGRSEKAVSLFKEALAIDPTLVHLQEKIIHFADEM